MHDGAEELYDHADDPREWANLAGEPGHVPVIAVHRRRLPPIDVAPAPGSAHRVLTYDPLTDEENWKGDPVRRDDPIPE